MESRGQVNTGSALWRIRPCLTLLRRAGLAESFCDLRVTSSCGPGKRRGPGFVVGQIRWRTARKKELHHRKVVVPCGPGERGGSILFVSRREYRAGIQQHLRAKSVDVARGTL